MWHGILFSMAARCGAVRFHSGCNLHPQTPSICTEGVRQTRQKLHVFFNSPPATAIVLLRAPTPITCDRFAHWKVGQCFFQADLKLVCVAFPTA